MPNTAPRAANGSSEASSRRKPREEPTPTHGDIMDAVARLAVRQDDGERQSDLMAMTVQRIEKALAEGLHGIQAEMKAIKDSIGDEGEDEYGKPIGRGVVGRLMRMERRLGRYDGWVKWATGAVAAVGTMGTALWMLWGEIKEFLR